MIFMKTNTNFRDNTLVFLIYTRIRALLLLSLFLLSVKVQSQVSTYSFANANAPYAAGTGMTNLATGTGNGGTMDDNIFTGINIGFSFIFDCKAYTTVGISTNGFIWFGTNNPAVTQYTPISTMVSMDGVIAAFATDIIGGASSGAKLSYGNPAAGVFMVEWNGVKAYGQSGTDDNNRWDMQILLYQTTNVVKIRIHDYDYGWNLAAVYGQVGLRGSNNFDYRNVFVACPAGWDWPQCPGTLNTSTCKQGTAGSCYPAACFGCGCAEFTFTPTSSCCIEPTIQASAFGSSSITTNSATVSWVRGNGDAGVIVLARAASDVNADPVNNTVYTANPVFGNGSQIGTGNYVVYKGSGTSVNVTGLTAGTTYFFAVYEYNALDICHLKPALTGNVSIPGCMAPTIQANTFGSSAITSNSATASWVRGNGDAGVIVLVKAWGMVDSDPVNGTIYTANAAFGSGSQIGTGNFVVYKGTGTSVNVTNLFGSVIYYFAVYEYNAAGICHLIPALTGSLTTNPATSACYLIPPLTGNVTIPFCGAGQWVGVTSSDWATASNWCTGIPTPVTDVIIPSAASVPFMPVITATNESCHNLTITPGGSVTLNSGSLSLYGNLTNFGTYTQPAGSLNITGSALQTISGITVYNINMNNSSGLLLNGNLNVNGVLTLTSGVINTGANYLIVSNSASSSIITGTGNTNYLQSYINGNLRRYWANNTDSYNFPVGTATVSARAKIKNVNLTGPTLNYFNVKFSSPFVNTGVLNPVIAQDFGIPYVSIAPEGEWQIDPDGLPTSGFYNLYLYLNAFSGLQDNLFGILKRPSLSVNAADWFAHGFLNPDGDSGRMVTDGYALRNKMTTFSKFAIGKLDNNPLPIELLSYTTECLDQNKVLIKWTTATETNNSHFNILRAGNDGVFENIATVQGAGNSIYPLTYSYIDNVSTQDILYYRLSQVDYNADSETLGTVSVNCDNLENETDKLTIFPNPANDIQKKQKGILLLVQL
jgi:hypothetical protein